MEQRTLGTPGRRATAQGLGGRRASELRVGPVAGPPLGHAWLTGGRHAAAQTAAVDR